MANKDIDEKLKSIMLVPDNYAYDFLRLSDEDIEQIKQLFLSEWEAQKPEKPEITQDLGINSDGKSMIAAQKNYYYVEGFNEALDQCDEIVRRILG